MPLSTDICGCEGIFGIESCPKTIVDEAKLMMLINNFFIFLYVLIYTLLDRYY
jgi:hypothetical protein